MESTYTLQRFAAVAVFALAGSAAQAAVSFTYAGPTLHSGGSSTSYGTPGFTGIATFDDAVVTDTFTGTLSHGSFTGGFGSSGQLAFQQSSYFTFMNGQITGWSVGHTIYNAVYNPYDPYGGTYYDLILRSSSTGGDFEGYTTFRLGAPYMSLPGVIGVWTREEAPAVVPLPLSLPLLAAGLACLGVWGRRRRVVAA